MGTRELPKTVEELLKCKADYESERAAARAIKRETKREIKRTEAMARAVQYEAERLAEAARAIKRNENKILNQQIKDAEERAIHIKQQNIIYSAENDSMIKADKFNM